MHPKLQFWTWFFRGTSGKSGLIRVFDRWFLLHIVVAITCLELGETQDLPEMAKNIVLPFSGVLLGMTFAWSGNITALLSTNQLSKLSQYHPEGISVSVYIVQQSILITLSTCILWTFAALKIISSDFWRLIIFIMSSMSVRECWQTMLFAQYMTICRDFISKSDSNKTS